MLKYIMTFLKIMIMNFKLINNTSILTLKYYYNLESLKPKVIGEHNNYRHYTNDQLTKLKTIKKLKKWYSY